MSRKEGKEKKKLDTLNLILGSRVQRRENVGGSLNLWSPQVLSHLIIGFVPFDDSKYNTQKTICQVICQKNFFVCVC